MAEMAIVLVEHAATHIAEVGPAQGFADITRHSQRFRNGEIYVFCMDASATVVANADNPRLVGKNLSTVHDGNGTLPAPEIYRIGETQGKGWFEYLWPNPVTRRVQRKRTYVMRVDDNAVCAAGYYRADAS